MPPAENECTISRFIIGHWSSLINAKCIMGKRAVSVALSPSCRVCKGQDCSVTAALP